MSAMRKRFAGHLLLLTIVANIAAALSLQIYALGARLPRGIAAPSKIALDNRAAETPMPFRIGETLNYDVAWSAFASAAKIQLCVTEHREILGFRTWHFRASAHTLSPLRSLLTIDDQIDSYTDTATFESRQYEMYLYEMGKKENQILHFSVAGRPQTIPFPAVVVTPGTLDPLGALYMLRQVDWRRTPEFRASVFDGEDLVEMRAHLEAAKELVAVNAGNFSATRILVGEYQHGEEVKGESLSLWFANDAARTPILLEAEIPFGSVRIELSSAPY
jgi:Protein of unknown function (DUF3108)